MNNNLIEINWDSYREFQQILNKVTTSYEMSGATYALWPYYGVKIFYHYENDVIYLFGKVGDKIDNENTTHDLTKQKNRHIIISPICKEYTNLEQKLQRSIEIFKFNFPNEKDIFFETIGCDWPFEQKPIYTWVSSYIYETQSLKTFAGKKLQKKRNHLNFFKQNYLDKIKCVKYDDSYKEAMLDFFKTEIEDSETTGEYEYKAIAALLNHYDQETMCGELVYYDNKLIGATLGIFNNDIYEQIIERANKDYRGAYQFLISSNLELNNINTKYINRQDDAGLENIRKSKLSYYPVIISESKVYKIND